jgi:hypothetical protein
MSRQRHTATAALEARLGARLAGALSAAQPRLPADVSERLRFARQQALLKAQSVRQPLRAAARQIAWSPALAGVPGGLGSPMSWWQRVASVLPLLMLVAGLIAIDRWADHEQVLAAADIDAALLADDLPPEAYADPGFAEFLLAAPNS